MAGTGGAARRARLRRKALVGVAGVLQLAACAGGPSQGGLSGCGPLPNCVTTGSEGTTHAPLLRFVGPAAAAQASLRAILVGWSGASLTVERPGFIAVEFRSPSFHWVDEAEFAFDPGRNVIRYRSGARLGPWDFNTNARRLRAIAAAFAAAQAAP